MADREQSDSIRTPRASTHTSWRAIAILFALLTFTIASCGRHSPPSTPADGRQTRVVALSPAIASIMHDVGLGALIVGRHASDEWTEPSIPPCGDQVGGIDEEALLRARPTHVFIQMGRAPPRLVELGAERGFVVKNYDILSLDEIRETARELWNWNGSPGPPGEGEPKRAPIEDEMDRAWSRRAGIDPSRVGRVLLLAQVDPAGALGPGSWHDDLLRRLGGAPAIENGAAFVTLDAEDVLTLAPDAIILFLPRAARAPAPAQPPAPAELRRRLGRIGELDIPAVTGGRIALVSDPMAQLPSTAMIRVADEMAAILERWSQ